MKFETGIVKDERPVVFKKMREAMKKGDMRMASAFGSMVADLEVLESNGIERFVVFENGTIEGIAE
jgi:hypothetical protein